MKRILYIINAFEQDAPNHIISEVARRAIASDRFECAVAAISRNGPLRQELEKHGARTALLNMSRVFSSPSALLSLSDTFQPDLIHVSLLRPILMAGMWLRLLRPAAPPLIFTHHGAHELHEKGRIANLVALPWFRYASKRVSHFAAVSHFAEKQLWALGIPREKTSVIYNGVDVDQFRPTGEKTSGPPLIAAAGNLRKIKGLGTFVLAAAVVSREFPDARFVIWGEGPERQHLEAVIAELRLQDRFSLPGYVSNLHDLLPTATVFVQASSAEAFGLAAAEAMSCGVPVVVSQAGSLPEISALGTTGLQFHPGQAEQLADAILLLLRDPETAAKMGSAARQRIVKKFRVDRMAETYMELYDRMTSK